MGTDCLRVVSELGECNLSLAIGVSQTMFRSHRLGTASIVIGGMCSFNVGRGFAVCAGTTSEGMEVTIGSLRAAKILGESCPLLFLCILIMATQVRCSSPSFEKEERSGLA